MNRKLDEVATNMIYKWWEAWCGVHHAVLGRVTGLGAEGCNNGRQRTGGGGSESVEGVGTHAMGCSLSLRVWVNED